MGITEKFALGDGFPLQAPHMHAAGAAALVEDSPRVLISLHPPSPPPPPSQTYPCQHSDISRPMPLLGTPARCRHCMRGTCPVGSDSQSVYKKMNTSATHRVFQYTVMLRTDASVACHTAPMSVWPITTVLLLAEESRLRPGYRFWARSRCVC